MLPGVLVVAIRSFDANQHRVTDRASSMLGQGDGPVADGELSAVASCSSALRQAEGLAEPLNRLDHVVVGQLGNDRARRHGTIRQHLSRYASSRGGKPKSGNTFSVSRKNVNSTTFPSETSSTWSAHGS